ncbi:hypothetical protein [Mucilaginibacter sp.]|uniref:hypothetical protein n=1 Tax=Mucilaginibacter sp. TaxID=1882438 RepID=UPI002617F0A8|nr:hypothetical protein [Mucilaginibacter sp.]MDB4924163.1 hypothetical protein [Mucilaginibacter sp.]
MNWKIIFQLSLFGLIMAFGTVSLIPEKIEPFFWLVIFVFCTYVIVKTCHSKYFLHGFLVSIVNCVWITVVHYFFYDSYTMHHPDMAAMYTGTHPRRMMLVYGPIFGVMFGVILGLFSLVASKILTKKAQ